jgi:hypothetical protein
MVNDIAIDGPVGNVPKYFSLIEGLEAQSLVNTRGMFWDNSDHRSRLTVSHE